MSKQNTASDRREPKGSGGLFHALSLSGGKDSTALLLLMIERGLPIDAVIWADTGMEFPEMYAHIARVDEHLYRERGLHITTLRSPKGFEYLMLEVPQQKKSAIDRRIAMGQSLHGYGWPGIKSRWPPAPYTGPGGPLWACAPGAAKMWWRAKRASSAKGITTHRPAASPCGRTTAFSPASARS